MCLSAPDKTHAAVFARAFPGAGAYRSGGAFELVLQRNANQETAFGFLNFPGMPVKGHEEEVICLDYGLCFPAADAAEAGLAEQARATLRIGANAQTIQARWQAAVRAVCEITPAEVEVLALKPALRGTGFLLRLFTPAGAGQKISVRPLTFSLQTAALCDARERELGPLTVQAGQVQLTTSGTITSLRLSGI
jgi:hypothetical protein